MDSLCRSKGQIEFDFVVSKVAMLAVVLAQLRLRVGMLWVNIQKSHSSPGKCPSRRFPEDLEATGLILIGWLCRPRFRQRCIAEFILAVLVRGRLAKCFCGGA